MDESGRKVREHARRLGFDLVGVADARLPAAAAFLRTWLAQGFHAGMDYMARHAEARLDPNRILEGARAVVVVARNYYVPRPRAACGGEGVVSRYAWGRDYHEVMRARLEDLRRFIESLGGRARVAVDTAPVLEKLWAVQAGLGWQGKHSNLITRSHASWVFLGEILTNLPLVPDRPFERDHCGRCTRCMDACPTGAIVAPYVIDARRCISYWTIEHRGVIPREMRAAIGNLIFGCDICQEVCPWNKFARRTDEEAFAPLDGLAAPRLSDLAALTEEEFRRRFRQSPIRRAKRQGFVRNVVIALGNTQDPAALPPLRRALEDADPVVRLHAAWALGRIGGAEARRALECRLRVESDPDVRAEIEWALNAAGR